MYNKMYVYGTPDIRSNSACKIIYASLRNCFIVTKELRF